ncbi:MAG: GNAT family N-acetyltransferase [Rhizobiaceae bacterium]|nr:GNAT family N-acetyltransferase [Rhizobiaceae bacterium]
MADAATVPAAVAVLDPSTFDEWPRLLGLIRRAFASMDGIIDPPSSAHHLTVETLIAKASSETVFLGHMDGAMAGCAFVADRPGRLYVGKLAVEPASQGRGVGSRLLDAIEALARRRGVSVLELQTRVELTDNHRTFARWGFLETGRTAHPGYDRPTSITLRKVLSP